MSGKKKLLITIVLLAALLVGALALYDRLSAEGEADPPTPAEATAEPAGETCLKEAAEGIPVASRSSLTSCQEFRASIKLI